jgi:hypothetical protein
MKIKNILKAPQILQKAKELNIDLSTYSPNIRVKLIDGGLHFESEKECFVSKSELLEYQSLDTFHTLLEGDECSSDNGEQLEYYYLEKGDIVQEGDEYENVPNNWNKVNELVGYKVTNFKGFRRKITKNPTT